MRTHRRDAKPFAACPRPLSVILALSVPAEADACSPTTSHPEIAAFGFYVDNDLCQVPPGHPTEWEPPTLFDWYGGGGDSCLFSIWTYEESNGIEGLQRGDEVHDDTCGGTIESDTLAFY